MNVKNLIEESKKALESGDFQRLKVTAAELINLDSENIDAWKYKILALSQLESSEQVLKAFEKWIELSKNESKILGKETWQHRLTLEIIDKALELNPQLNHDSIILFTKGIALNGLVRHKEALDFLNKAIEWDSELNKDSSFLYQKGVSLNSLWYFKCAFDALNKAEKLILCEAELGLILLQKGIALLNLYRNVEALNTLNKAEKIIPNRPEYSMPLFYQKGSVYISCKEYDKALDFLNRVLELLSKVKLGYLEGFVIWFYKYIDKKSDKSMREYIHAMINFQMALAQIGVGEKSNALDTVNNTFQLIPEKTLLGSHPLIQCIRGVALIALNKQNGISIINRVVNVKSEYEDDALAWLGSSIARFYLSQFPASKKSLDRACQLNSGIKESGNYLLISKILSSQLAKTKEEKVESFNKISNLILNLDHLSFSFLYKALSFIEQGDNNLALNNINEAIKYGFYEPMDFKIIALTTAFCLKGFILLEIKKELNALEAFTDATKYAENLPNNYPVKALAWFWKSMALVRINDTEKALDALMYTLNLNINLPLNFNEKIELALDTGEYIQKYLDAKPLFAPDKVRHWFQELVKIPQYPIETQGVSITHCIRGPSSVSGDFYNIIERQDGSFGIYLVDVEGHGIKAFAKAVAVHMILLESETTWGQGEAQKQLEIADGIISKRLGTKGIDVTMNFTEIDPISMKLRHANAGIPSFPLLFRYGQVDKPERLEAWGTYVGGGYSLNQSPQVEKRLGQGDIIVITSDGVKEARSRREGSQFGEKGIINAVVSACEDSPEQIADEILRSVSEFERKEEPGDDQAVIVAKIKTISA